MRRLLVRAKPPGRNACSRAAGSAFMTSRHVGKASRMALYARELFVSLVFWERMVPISTSSGSPRWRVGFPYLRASNESMVARSAELCWD